jgi:hypothetical protein
MEPIEIFKLIAATLSGGAAAYGLGHMLYVALKAPTRVQKMTHHRRNYAGTITMMFPQGETVMVSAADYAKAMGNGGINVVSPEGLSTVK